MIRKYWHYDVTIRNPDGTETTHARQAQTSGIGTADQFASWLRSRDYRRQDVTKLEVREVKPDEVDYEKDPLAAHLFGQPNQLLVNAAGQAVNQNHEIVPADKHLTTEEADAALAEYRKQFAQKRQGPRTANGFVGAGEAGAKPADGPAAPQAPAAQPAEPTTAPQQ